MFPEIAEFLHLLKMLFLYFFLKRWKVENTSHSPTEVFASVQSIVLYPCANASVSGGGLINVNAETFLQA